MSIIITEKALKEIKNIMQEQALPQDKSFLRVGVKGGGCSGFSYVLDITEEEPTENDEVFNNEGLKVVIDSRSLLYIEGVTLDFKDELMTRGFAFHNPNATSVCGCGSSFSA